jgi:malate dehydrogenase (oxaloacetate-decarboxylating)
LEDIAQPKCFQILDALRERLAIPVWHDDQQGTATVLLAALLNALELVDKEFSSIKLALIGIGAANVATYRLLKASGIDPAGIVACDSKGILHKARVDIERQQTLFSDKWQVCNETNGEQLTGGIAEALRGADVCVAFSSPDPSLIRPDWVRKMAKDAIVFACANPTPEIWPWDAEDAGARIVATGRGDFANQVNNSLGFPGIFRGVLDVRARTITDEMAIAAARELAGFAQQRGIHEGDLIPRMDEWEVFPRIAVATAMKAQEQGIAGVCKSEEALYDEATAIMGRAREATHALMRGGFIPAVPED